MTDNTLPPLPVGGPYLETGKFRPLGDYDGQRFFRMRGRNDIRLCHHCRQRSPRTLLAEIGKHPHRHCGGVACLFILSAATRPRLREWEGRY